MSAIYRVQQFLRAANSWLHPGEEDLDLASELLPPEALDLFASMPRYDRRHALDVLGTLRREGHTDPDLLAAALLHDVGKTGHERDPLRLWHRVMVVLLRTLAPGRLDAFAKDEPGSWRQPFFVQQNHASIGAELASRAGCSQVTMEMIRRHEDPIAVTDDPLLAALKSADGRN
jgi:putative nucleotidyltransferase with HDIG domain